MDFVNLLPGVSTPSGNRDATINGLPRGTINITLDGVNIQDNTLRSTDGFFAIVSPRLDAIEEVTVQTATQGADSSGQGAVQIKFVTTAGTNHFSGSGYEYYRSDKLNANTWFNNRAGVAKPKLKQNQFGGRFGGPIVIPGLYDGHNKAFFFVNYEEVRQPSDTTRNRTMLNPAAQAGIYSYPGGCDQRPGARGGQRPARLGRSDDRQAAHRHPLGDRHDRLARDTDVNLQRYTLQRPGRVDAALPDRARGLQLHRPITGSPAPGTTRSSPTTPDTLNNLDATFPGFPAAAGQASIRKGFSNAMRSTLSRNMVNEARVGYSSAPVKFFDELNTGHVTAARQPAGLRRSTSRPSARV